MSVPGQSDVRTVVNVKPSVITIIMRLEVMCSQAEVGGREREGSEQGREKKREGKERTGRKGREKERGREGGDA